MKCHLSKSCSIFNYFLLKKIIHEASGEDTWSPFPQYPFSRMNPLLFDKHGKHEYNSNAIYNFGNGVGVYDIFEDEFGSDYRYLGFDKFFAQSGGSSGRQNFPFEYTTKFLDFTDTMSTLMFGKETTIGQMCSYAKALDEDFVTTLPGYCCLDAPYQGNVWGETVSDVILCDLFHPLM